MTVKDAALRAAVLRALADRVREEYDASRVEVDKALRELSDTTGAASVKVTLGDQVIATVTLAGGKPTARVIDEDKFLAWVTENRPTETIERVRESYRKAVLDKGGVDPSSGEFVPGVEVVDGSPYVSTRFADGGREAVAQAWRTGTLPASARPLAVEP